MHWVAAYLFKDGHVMTPEHEKLIREQLANNSKPVIGSIIRQETYEFLTNAWDHLNALLEEIEQLRAENEKLQTFYDIHVENTLEEIHVGAQTYRIKRDKLAP